MNRTIRLPLREPEYDWFVYDRPIYAKSRLEERHERHPERFPEASGWGYALYGAAPTPLVNKSCDADEFGWSQGVRSSLK
jgi:hypothetical protein